MDKLAYKNRENAVLNRLEKSKEYKKFRAEIERTLNKQVRLILKDQTIIDGIILLIGKAETNENAKTFLGRWWQRFINVVKTGAFFGFLVYAGEQGGQAALVKMGSDETFDLRNEQVIAYIEKFGLNNSKLYDETTKKQIISIITKGRQELLTNYEVSKLLREEMTQLNKTRAEMIAFNEMTHAVNAVEYETMKRNNVKKVRWVTVMDERVCPICEPLHNEVIAINSNFTGVSDGEIVFNGLRPPAHVNCRCYLEEVIEGTTIINDRIVWTGE